MRFRIRLMAVGVAAASCVTFGLTATVPAVAATADTIKSTTSAAGCLFGNASVSGGIAKRSACNGSLQGEQWTPVGKQLRNGFNQCLGVQGGSTAAGASLIVTACKNPVAPTQTWTSNLVGGDTEILNIKSGLLIHAAGTSGVNQQPGSIGTGIKWIANPA